MHCPDTERILFSKDTIAARVRELAAQISGDYQGREVLVVAVLKGAMVFCADLIREMTVPVRLSCLSASSYGQGAVAADRIHIRMGLDTQALGKHILLVEDIIDTGRTLAYIGQLLRSQGAASLAICTLLDKPSRREVPLVPDYIGFPIENHFVVGYGLDYAEKYRQLPYIAVLKPEVYG